MRAQGRAENVVRVLHGRGPVTHCLAHRLLEGGLARADRNHFGPEQFHALHIGRLPLHVDPPHVNGTVKSEPGAHRGGGHPVLPGTSFCDNALLTQPPCHERLTDCVIDLVGPGVKEILPFEVHLCPAHHLTPPSSVVKRSGPPAVIRQEGLEFTLKFVVDPRPFILLRQFLQRRHQGLRHEHAAILPKVTGGVRDGWERAHDGSVPRQIKKSKVETSTGTRAPLISCRSHSATPPETPPRRRCLENHHRSPGSGPGQ